MSFKSSLDKLDTLFLRLIKEELTVANQITFSTYQDWLHVAKYQASQLKELQYIEAGVRGTSADPDGFIDVAIAFKLNGKLFSGHFGERGDYVVRNGVYTFAKAVTYMKKLIHDRLQEEPEFKEEEVNKALFIKIWSCEDPKELLDLLTQTDYAGHPRRLSLDVKNPDLYSEFNK